MTYAGCRGLPCPIVSTDVVSGNRHVLTGAAGFATLVRAPDGARLVHEARPVPGAPVRSVRLDGGVATDLGAMPSGTRLAAALFGGSTTTLPAGWVLVAPDGHLAIEARGHGSQLRHIPDGLTVQLDEVLR